MERLLKKLVQDFPDFTFISGEQFYWSPQQRRIIYNTSRQNDTIDCWSLLHELGHAVLDHASYDSDLELVEMESQAWDKAEQLSKTYGIDIDENHIQDCLDTYRDWLHQRSACPKCGNRSFQQNSHEYHCFNCASEWKVSSSRFCRPYRMKAKSKTSPSGSKTTFV